MTLPRSLGVRVSVGFLHVILAAWALLHGDAMAQTRPATNPSTQTGAVTAPGATLRKLAGDFKFTEGPACDAEGNVYFTDQPNDRICKWSTDGTLFTFMQPCGRSNGLYFDRDYKRLLACADEHNQLWSIDVATKQVEVLVKDFDGKLLNGPNDLWVRPADGAIYFTDPFYKRSYWNRGPLEQSGQHVYFLSADRKAPPRRVTEDLKQPNGIVGTPDGKTLYVADIGAGITYAYTIAPDGTLGDKRQFCAMGSDGMTLDAEGNVYLTNKAGVTVFNPRGEQVEQIAIPDQRWTANVTFGGPDRRTLFITAGTGLYAIDMQVAGAAPPKK